MTAPHRSVSLPKWLHEPPTRKWYGLKYPGGWECSLAAISKTTTHMHGHHETTIWLAGVTLGRELRARALSHTAPVRLAIAGELGHEVACADSALTQEVVGCIEAINS